MVVRLLREELGLLQQPGSYVGEVVKVMGTKKVLVKVHPEGKYGMDCVAEPVDEYNTDFWMKLSISRIVLISRNLLLERG